VLLESLEQALDGREPLASIGEPITSSTAGELSTFGPPAIEGGSAPGTSKVAVLTSRVSLLSSVIGGPFSIGRSTDR
jgi:hypothetical protein